jgi:hypothetical protein
MSNLGFRLELIYSSDILLLNFILNTSQFITSSWKSPEVFWETFSSEGTSTFVNQAQWRNEPWVLNSLGSKIVLVNELEIVL